MKYPVFIGFGLSESEKQLVDFILSPLEKELQKRKEPYFSDLASGICYYPDLTYASLQNISDWMQPFLIFAGSRVKINEPDFFQKIFETGTAAVWQCPGENQPIFPPPLSLPESRYHAYIITEEGIFRKIFRQILQYGGFHVRVDFQSNNLLETELNRISSKKDLWPSLILVDLDSTKIDVKSFFYFLRSLFQKNPELKSKTSILAMKDFSKPGLNLQTISSSLKPLTKRIFHPHEALLGLCEAAAAGERERNLQELLIGKLRNLEEVLYGTPSNFRDPAAVRNLTAFMEKSRVFGKFSLFTWMFEYLLSDEISSGVILSPEPVIDSRDFFNGIGRP